MSRKMPRETNRTCIRLLGLSLLSVGASLWGCGIDENGTIPVETDKPASSSSGDAVSSSSGNSSSNTSSSSSNASTSSGMGGQGGAGQGGAGGGQAGAGGGPTAKLPKSCNEILAADSTAPSGTYTIDIDGAGPRDPFPVVCKMLNSKGWTLVALEKPNDTQNLFLLGVEKGTPENLVAGENAIIGLRFKGLYSAVRIEWDSSEFLTFDVGSSEIFEDTVNHNVPISNFKTSDSTLEQWLTNGAKLCRAASQSANNYPGDSSWAIKPTNDNNTSCGCNSSNWAGRGAFYGGSGSLKNYCGPWSGGFVGVRDTNEVKSVTVDWYTHIYVL